MNFEEWYTKELCEKGLHPLSNNPMQLNVFDFNWLMIKIKEALELAYDAGVAHENEVSNQNY